MKLIVFGATGGTGVPVVRQALEAGHQVTAVVRDPGRLDVSANARLDVVQADVREAASIAPAVAGSDAVISALGGRGTRPTTICRDGTAAIITAMRETGARRLLVVSAAGFHTEGDSLPVRLLVKPLLGRFLRHPFADMAEMEARVRDSGLDWTIVCPPQLTDKPYTGNVRSNVGANAPGFRIPRADLAGFLLGAVNDEPLARTTVSVSG